MKSQNVGQLESDEKNNKNNFFFWKSFFLCCLCNKTEKNQVELIKISNSICTLAIHIPNSTHNPKIIFDERFMTSNKSVKEDEMKIFRLKIVL